jgi:hypothetical protein
MAAGAGTAGTSGAAAELGRRAIFDVATAAIAVGTMIVLLRTKEVPEALVILGTGVLGLLIEQVSP